MKLYEQLFSGVFPHYKPFIWADDWLINTMKPLVPLKLFVNLFNMYISKIKRILPVAISVIRAALRAADLGDDRGCHLVHISGCVDAF